MKKTLLTSLASLTLRHRAEAEAAGLPALMMAAERAVSTLHHGDHRQRRAGGGERFWQFRAYDPGDRPQDIDWRQSGKSDRVYIRQKEWQTAQSIFFWVQNDRGMTLKTGSAAYTKHEAGTILSLALGLLLVQAGERIGPFADPVRAGRSDGALQHLCEILSSPIDPLPAGPVLPPPVKLPERSGLILTGDFMHKPEALEKSLFALAAQAPQGLLIQTLDPAEFDLPFDGRMIFRSSDDLLSVPVGNVPSIREAYRAKLHDHIDVVRRIARHHGYRHVLHVTDRELRPTLVEALQALSPQRADAAGV